MQTFLINIFKLFIKLIYAILKLFPTKNKVVLISRFHNTTSIDFKLLKKELLNNDPTVEIKILNHKNNSLPQVVKHLFLEMYHIATSYTAIIDSYIIPISVLNHKDDLVVIQIWHAFGAIKKFGYASLDKADGRPSKMAHLLNMHHNYDYVISCSDLTATYYQVAFKVPIEKIKTIGVPKMDYLQNIENKWNFEEDFYLAYPNLKQQKIILYAPTFRKNDTLDNFKLFKDLPKNHTLIIKKHPLDKTIYPNNENILTDVNFSSSDLLFVSDYLITDYSSISFEAALLNIPTFFYIYDYLDYQKSQGLFIKIKDEYPTISFENAEDLCENLINDKYDAASYRNFRNKYLSNNKNITQEILKLIERIPNE